MSQINYLIKQDSVKTTRKKRWVRCDNAGASHYTPVMQVMHSECTIIENPVLTKLRKKFKQAKVRIRERAFHMHGVAYVELRA